MSGTGPSLGKRLAVALFSAILLLSACDSAEERAEAHFRAGMAHLEKGDVERALIEFRNVFKLNDQHKEARLTFARLERDRGNVQIAYNQYLMLIEQYPDNLEGHRAMAEMALQLGNWEDLERYAQAAIELAPDDIGIQSLNNTLAYTEAIRTGDAGQVDFAIHSAHELLDADPSLMTARQIIIDDLIRAQDWAAVLDETDAALALNAKLGELYAIRLRALQELQNPEAIAAQLTQMMQIFPGDPSVEQMLVEHHVDHGNLDAAEAILRDKAELLEQDSPSVQRLIAFINENRGAEAAIAEMDAIIAAGGVNTPRFRTMRAALKFQSGDTDVALSEMRELLDGAERTTQIRASEVEYARMLFMVGQPAPARVLVEQVLNEDPAQVEAVKLKASWLIDDDRTGDAIILLREALHETPRDSHLMTLMARAHERNGDRELVGEMLALATEVSQNAPEEALNYSRFLLEGDDAQIAERVLVDALRQDPDNAELLTALGHVYLNLQDWARLEAVLHTIDAQDDAGAVRQSKELRAQMLAARQQTDELISFLGELANDPEFGLPADIALIRLMLAQDDVAGATRRLDELLQDDPNSVVLRFVKARILTGAEEYDTAERIYRTILTERPDAPRVWLALFALEAERNGPAAARAVLTEALATLPEDPDLLMVQAEEYERAGELDAAISVYEMLFPLSDRSLVVANNLASLLTTHRNDDESLRRAQHLARRLRGTRIPMFQDTYGWVAYRLGNYREALIYLESAAEAMPDHPLVLYHLGRAYAAAERPEDALRTYRIAGTLMPHLDVTPSLEAEIERLNAQLNTGQ